VQNFLKTKIRARIEKLDRKIGAKNWCEKLGRKIGAKNWGEKLGRKIGAKNWALGRKIVTKLREIW